jgi:cbb3-type cytochrome oxidase subunit 3
MSLGDIMGNAGLSIFAEVALVIFFLVFVGIVIYVISWRRSKWDHQRNLPLDDGERPDNLEDKPR